MHLLLVSLFLVGMTESDFISILQKAYFNYRVRRIKRKKKAGIDPIKNAFERMKVCT